MYSEKNLLPDTSYSTNIFIMSVDEHTCVSTPISEFTTLEKDIRAVKEIKNRNKKIDSQHGLDLYTASLTNTTKSKSGI